MTEVVKIYQLVENLSLEVVYGDEESLNRTIKTGEISRPGLELTGYFNYYSHDRLQLFGSKEITFAERMMPEERLLVMRRLCAKDTPAFIVSRGLEIPEELITAKKRKWRFCITFTDFNFPFTRGTIQLFRWPFSCSDKCPWGFS